MEAQKVMALTNAVIKSTGGVSGMTANSVVGLAEKLSRLTGVDDEAVQSAENMLLTFTKIGKDVFPDTTEAVLNMATAMNQGAIPTAEQLSSTAIQVGKALNDPIAGVTALQKVGVKLTETQKEQIKSFMAVGDIASAQKIILSELTTEFGGAAEAAGETFAGKLAKLHTQIGNVKEGIGGALLPVLSLMIGMIGTAIPAAIDFLRGPFGQLTGWFDALVGYGRAGSPIESITDNLRHLADAFKSAFSGEGVTSDGVFGMVERLGVGTAELIAKLTGIGATFKTVLQRDVLPVLGDMGNILITSIIPAFMDVASVVGPPLLDVFTILADVAGTFLGLGWDILERVIGFFADNEAAGKALGLALAGIVALKFVDTVLGWAGPLGNAAGAMGNLVSSAAGLPAKLANIVFPNFSGAISEQIAEHVDPIPIPVYITNPPLTGEGSASGVAKTAKEGLTFAFQGAFRGVGEGVFEGLWEKVTTGMAGKIIPPMTTQILMVQNALKLLMNPWTAVILGAIVAGFLIWKYREQIMDGLSTIGTIFKDSILPPIRNFFTQTLPDAIADFFAPENIGRRLADLFVAALVLMFPPTLAIILYIKFKEQVDAFVMQAGALFVNFVTHTIPDLLADNWKFIVMALWPQTALWFYREQILAFGQQAGAFLLSLVTDTLPNFIRDHWRDILFAIFPLQMAIIKWREDILSFGGTAGRAILDFIMGLPTLIGDRWKDIFTGVPAAFTFFVTQIGTGLATALTTVTEWLTGLGDWLTEHFAPWNWIKQAFVDMYHGFVSELGKIFGSGYVTDWVGRLGAWLTENLNPWNWVKAAFTFFKDAIVTDLNFITGLFSGLPGRIIEALGDLLSLLLQSGKDIVQGLYTGAQAAWDLAWRWLRGIPDSIVRAIPNPLDILKSVGRQVAEGFLSGVQGAWGAVTSFFGGSMDELIAEAERKWESRSPSQVMWRLGKNILLGLRGGLEEEAPGTLSALAAIQTQWVASWQGAWDETARIISESLATQESARTQAAHTGLLIGKDLGGAIAEGLDIMVRNLGLEGGLEDLLDKTRSFVTGLHSELNRLLGLPTQQSAQEQLDLAELQLKRFQLETQAAAEAEQRERQLGDLRAQLSAARASENDADVSGIQARIDALEGTMGPAERQIENLDKEIDRIKRLGEERKLQNDIIAAHGLVADKTLLTDQAVTKAGEAWVLVIGDQTEALHNQTGDIWSQYLPAIGALEQSWRDTADAAYDAAQAQIDAAKASQTALLDAAQAQVDLNNARAAGALSEIAYGLQSQTAEGALGRALNNIGGGALLGQFMTKVAGGMSIPAALALFFGPHGAFVNKFGELQTQLLAEGIKLQPDFVTVNLLTDTAGSAAAGVVATTKVGTDTVDALAGGFNTTSAGLDTVAVGVTDGTAAIGTALGVVDLSVGKVYDSIGSVEDGLLTLINIASQIEAHTADTARLLLSGVNILGLPIGGGVGEAPGQEVPGSPLGSAPLGMSEAEWAAENAAYLLHYGQGGIAAQAALVPTGPAWSIPGTPEYDAMKLYNLAKLQTLPSVAFSQPLSGSAPGGMQITFGTITVSGANITKQDVRDATYDGTSAAMRAKGLIPQ